MMGDRDGSLRDYVRRTRVRRRPDGWEPHPEDVVINAVAAEFPQFGVDEVVAEVGRRGHVVSADLVRAWLEVS